MIRKLPHVTGKDALAMPCPLCGAEISEPCTYVVPKSMTVRQLNSGGIVANMVQARMGKPTSRPHNERFSAAWHKMRRAMQLSPTPQRPLTGELRKVRDAMNSWDMDNHNKLYEWLSKHGNIFWEK